MISTTASPLHGAGAQTTCPPKYSEYPPATQGFNQILAARAAKHNLTYIDTYPASRDLMELSFDGAHYADPVSKAVAVQVERWLEEVLLAPR